MINNYILILYLVIKYWIIYVLTKLVTSFYIVKYKCISTYNHLSNLPSIIKISKKEYLLTFYINNTECKLIVTKNTGPLKYYMATDFNNNDISNNILPYFNVSVKKVTPNILNYEEIKLWDLEDNSKTIQLNENINN